jgi:pyrroloquinoline quinone biosynthesis protein E
MRKAEFHSTDHIKRLAAGLKENGFIGFDVTGGEPCLHPGIVDLVGYARFLGLAPRIITLGQYLMRPMKSAPGYERQIDGLIGAGIVDLLLSVHAVDSESFAAITGENWEKLLATMHHLDALGFDYGTNTTVCEQNFRLLPEIAREIVRHGVYVANFIIMNAYYAWSQPDAPTERVQGHYGEIRPYLLEARDILEAEGIAVNVRYAPLCTMRGLERNLVGVVGVRHDPHEWMNAIDHMAKPGSADPEAMAWRLPLRDFETHYPLEPSPARGEIFVTRADGGKVFPAKCRGCRAMPVCDGIDANYFAQRGAGELEPYADFRGDLIDRERLRYGAGHVIKTAQFADACGTVRGLLRGQEFVVAA